MKAGLGCRLFGLTAGGMKSMGIAGYVFVPEENARAGETAPKFQCQPTLAKPLCCVLCFRTLIYILESY